MTSDVPLWARLRAAASRAGTGVLFPPASQGAVIDDHTPFLHAGVPSVDLIDFSYACWQKICDDLSQVSLTNLTRVGHDRARAAAFGARAPDVRSRQL